MRHLVRGFISLLLVVVVAGVSLWLYLAPAEPPSVAPLAETVRTVANGSLIGRRGWHGANAWIGIPYAKPPVGSLRFQPPLPPADWQERLVANESTDVCTQLSPGTESGLTGSEDCLYLNVFAPPFGPKEVPTGGDRLPVMVWIHGGGNTSSGSMTDLNDGSRLAVEQSVIVVTFNYRLGPPGWFMVPGVEDPVAASGNFGTLDMIAALEWTKRNIAGFGGDPERVTIFGESSGGHNVLSMMASPLAIGLFQRAIVQSGGYWTSSASAASAEVEDGGHKNSSREVIYRLMMKAGLANARAEARKRLEAMGPDLLPWLQSLPIADLFHAYEGGNARRIEGPWVIGDGHVLPASESFIPASSVPVILGSNRDETKLFLMLDDAYIDRWLGMPVGIRDSATYQRDTAYGSDLWRVMGVTAIAEAMNALAPGQVYTYRFEVDDWRDLGLFDLKELLGATHGSEIFFVFGNFPRPFKALIPEASMPANRELAGAMMSYWAEFARTGKPGRGNGDLPAWMTSEFGTLRLDSGLDQGIGMMAEPVSYEAVVERFVSDGSYESDRQKCEVYVRLFDMFGAPDRGRLGCGEVSFEGASPLRH